MKRLAALAAILTMAAVQSAALADFTYPAEYTGGNSDSANVDATGYSTVLITDESGVNIVYVNQADSAYAGATDFLLKSNPAVGKYKVLLGSGSGSPKETYFYVGLDSDNSSDLYMNRLQSEVEVNDSEEVTYNIGYYVTVPTAQLSNYNSLKVGYKSSSNDIVYGGLPLWDDGYDSTAFSGEGEAYLVFQLNDVSESNRYNAAVYLSADRVLANSSSPAQAGGN